TPELRLILVGNIGCGKTLTINTLLTDSASISPLVPSRVNEVRCGVSEGRRLKLVETPRWYWKGVHVDLSVQRETERALSLVAPGPHAFLILVPVGQFTEMECRIPAELERVFGRGALEHSLVLLTCGDYLTGRDHERYVSLEEPGLGAMVNECGGRWHVINNRRPNDRQQVRSLLEKVEKLTQRTGGYYLPSAMQKEVEERVPEKEYELQRRYTISSSPTNAPTSTNGLISSTRPNNTSFSSSSTATYTAFPKTNTSFLSSSNAASSSSPSTNTSFLSSSTSVSSSPSTNTAFSSSSPSVSSSPSTNTAFSSSSPSVSSSPSTNTAFSSSSPSVSSSPSTNNPFLSSSTSVSSSPSTNTTFLSSSNALFSRSTAASSFSFPSDSSNELRLVLLGRSGSGKSAAGNAILGRDEFKLRKDDATGATTQTCVKGTAVVGQKQVMVDTPDWFSPSCPPETLATHLSSCIDLCAPGPHAFLLCVPITLPGRSNLHDLASIRNSFGNDFIQRCTLVLFTHCDILKDVKVEEYIAAKRPELLELVEKCGDRYHVLKQDRNGDNIKDLLEKVEQVIKENRRSHYS
ncbi:GTPase IMAP family member 8 isoform X1, partial [Silurus meridionalis]